MYTATIPITITNWVPTNGQFGPSAPNPTYITATFTLNDTSSGVLPSGQPTNVFRYVAQPKPSILIVPTPSDYNGAVQVTFQLSSTEYVLLGIVFAPPTPGGVGRQAFRTVEINRDQFGSQLTVTDKCENEQQIDYTFGVLIQHVASGNIGIWDPQITNAPPVQTGG